MIDYSIEYKHKIIYSYLIVLNNKTGYVAYDLSFEKKDAIKVAMFDCPTTLLEYTRREGIKLIGVKS